MAANDALDFDDLLRRTAWLFQEQPEVLNRYQERYQYLLVDEFQDTNTAQYELVHAVGAEVTATCSAWATKTSRSIAFRGADYRNVMRFREDFPEAKVILLEQNYRSTQTILDAANAVIAQEPVPHAQEAAHRSRQRLAGDRRRRPTTSRTRRRSSPARSSG